MDKKRTVPKARNVKGFSFLFLSNFQKAYIHKETRSEKKCLCVAFVKYSMR